MELMVYVFFQEFYGFQASIKVFHSLWVYFGFWCKAVVWSHALLSYFPSTTYWRDFPFPMVYSCLLCQKFKVLLIFLLSTSILLNRLYIPLHLIFRECYDIFLNIPFFLKRQMNTPEVKRTSWSNIEIRLGLCSGLSYLKDPVSFSRLITTLPTWQLDILSQKPGDIALSHIGVFNYHFLRIFKSLADLL